MWVWDVKIDSGVVSYVMAQTVCSESCLIYSV